MEGKSFAEIEFEVLAKTDPKSDMLLVKDQILGLCEAFGKSGQSGGSAPYTAGSILNELRRHAQGKVYVEVFDREMLHSEFAEQISLLNQGMMEKGVEDLEGMLSGIGKLLMFEPLMPVTGMDEEWGDVRDFGSGQTPWYQNRRCSALFKDGVEGKPYYIDAIVKRDQRGACWSGFAWLSEEDYQSGDSSLMVGKKGYVKSFPFTPKTFYIDVVDVEVAKDDWESFVKDPSQFDEVWEYYDRF